MKSIKLFVSACLALVLLVACNTTSSNDEGTNTSGGSGGSGASIDDILDKSITAMSELKSYSMDMDLTQTMNIAELDQPFVLSISTKTDMTVDPLRMYQVMTLLDDSEEMDFDTETYMTEDGIYTSSSEDDTWIKFPVEFSEEMMKQQQSPDEQLKILKGFSEEIKLTEEADEYVLTIKGSGEKLIELTKELLTQTGDSLLEGLDEELDMLSMLDIKELHFVIHIDKNTFYQTKIDLDMDIEMNVEGEMLTMQQQMRGIVTNINEVEPIIIPEEVLNNAQEIDF